MRAGLEAFSARLDDPADISAADSFCARLACERRGDFNVARRFAAPGLRPHVAALYAFVRVARDMVEDPEHEGARAERLTEWRRQAAEMRGRPPSHPVFAALARTAARFELPAALFDDIIAGCLQDVERKRYATYEELLGLCRRAANPLGRLVLMVHGYREEGIFRYCDALCSALLLTRFWRDLALDLKRDRIYIPEEDFAAFGYAEADLRMGVCNERFRELMKFEVNRTRALFEGMRPLPKMLKKPLSWQVVLAWYGGRETLRQIRKLGFDTITHRPLLGRFDWLPLILRTLLKP
ncbi:MAG: squalene/phytoene synthase family protein [Elusimicrobia bacterium]|nr:squalene/phytoene synthase family protein [Elusimicrobiota bacterium]